MCRNTEKCLLRKSTLDLRRQELLRGVAAGREVRPCAGGGHQPAEDFPHLLVSPCHKVLKLVLQCQFYSNFGIFNVSVLAKNRVTEVAVFDDVMSIVTEAPCAPPKLGIPFNSTNPQAPTGNIAIVSFKIIF